MEAFDSIVIGAAREHAVPAGSALAVDRDRFSAAITARLEELPGLEVRREEVPEVTAGASDADVVLATGPLTSPALADSLGRILGGSYLYFYDSIAPIVDGESLDTSPLFWASRYGKGGGDDYLNAPLDRDGYTAFREAILGAELLPLHEFEDAKFFEGCLPIEELARRGEDTLRYGPMKPVGLRGPDGRRPWAVVQLRQENLAKSQFNLVGFQSRMKWPEQQRVFRMLPGFERAEFVRLGQIHRNTFINSPAHLDRMYRLKLRPRIRLAGQITGVEGYLESAATGLLVALYLFLERRDGGLVGEGTLPSTTALGALARHLTESDPAHFQPANINHGLFAPLEPLPRKDERRAAYARRAHAELAAWRSRSAL
jgi:methylenetetrahydrofolate--tRNA-(uracil-5-)-methyltransferase